MKKSIMVLALMSVCSMAYATGASNNCNGSGSCPQNETTTLNTTNQGGTGYGGQGGNGGNSSASAVGTGGNATGGSSSAIGIGGSADVRNSSTNLNANTNKVDNSNIQGQIQGQGQKQSTSNSNNSTSNVTVEGDNFEAKRIPVNTAFAPSIAPTANCALSVSAGVSVIGFSGSFGKAYIDKECVANEDVRNVALVLGDKETAEAMKCISSDTYRKARLSLGRACPVEQE